MLRDRKYKKKLSHGSSHLTDSAVYFDGKT